MKSSPEPHATLFSKSLSHTSWLMIPFVLAWTSGTAQACPDCEAGRRARTAVWHEEFAGRVLAVLSPFLIPLALAGLIEAKSRR
jgi:hypothetical protein